MRSAIMVLLLTLAPAIGQAEETPSQAVGWPSQILTLSALKTWGTKDYVYSAREPGGKETKILGTVSLSTELTDDTVILKDKYQITFGGKKMSLEIIHTCLKNNFLSPTRIESKGEGSEEFATFTATVTQGKAMVRSQDGRQTAHDLPEDTITMAAMMRLVTLVSRTPGMIYTYKHSLESEEMNLKENYRLEVLPPETISIGERQVQCSKFKLTGGGIQPAYYWVTKEGVLQRLMMDDRKVMELKNTP